MTHETTTQKSPLLKKISWNLVFSGIMGILILTAFMQTLELNQMRGFLRGQEAKAVSTDTPTAAPSALVQPENSRLPSQVGGC